jgi:polysaccharide export outer membrane protein
MLRSYRSVVVLLALGVVFFGPLAFGQIDQSGLGSVLGGGLSGNSTNGDDSQTGAGQIQSLGQTGGQAQGQSQIPSGVNLQNNPQSNSTNQNSTNNSNAASRDLDRLPPDPLTEFQRLVANSTGRMLPIYGAKLFRNTPSTFAPVDRVPVTPNYVVGPGDELLIQVWGQVTLNSRFTVDRLGDIYIPQVGTMRVAGLTFAQMQSYLKAQMGRVFRNFDLNVNLGQLRSIQVFVVGQARRPGSYTVSSLSTLVNAIFVTGGPTPQGSLRHIQLKRAGEVVVDFDLYDLLLHGDKSKDVPLLPGDVIYIPAAGPQVAVTGSVNVPAIYELKSPAESTVGDVLGLASGLAAIAAGDKVRIERIDAHKMRAVSEEMLDAAGRSAVLRDGDIVEVVPIVDRYKDAVTLRGNVANPGHYVWKPGMRVGDLFPDKDSLITRDYWLKRGRLGLPVLTYLPVCPVTPRSYGTSDLLNAGATGESTSGYPASALSSEANGNSNLNSILNANQNSTSTLVPGFVPDGAQQECIPWSQQYGPPSEIQNDPNSGTTTQTPTQAAGAVPQQRAGDDVSNSSQGSGRSSAAAVSERSSSQFPPKNDVKLSEPDIDWGYAVIERQSKATLQTSLLPFNLGKLVLDGDSSQNIELQPGDVITIFSKADLRVPQSQQTRFVRLEGEFVSSGVYSVLPGETLQQLVARAGGFSPDAYLYGSEFTRESTRRQQQQRLNDYIDQIALQTSVAAANAASSTVSALDSAAALAARSQNESVIASLRQARSSGRIVLDVHPDNSNLSQLPPLPLEDGDAFIVPHIPSTISVAGAVYNPNAFVYDPHRRVGDYLRLAGGSNRDADKNRAYVIRADGSVISKQQISGLRRNGFESLRVYPGDTVIVPLNLHRGATLRTVVDIAQIVGQFGLAIAAANVVF